MYTLDLKTKREIIKEKVKILGHFAVLPKGDREKRSAVVSVLAECKTETEMERCLYNVLRGNETLDELLQRKGILM